MARKRLTIGCSLFVALLIVALLVFFLTPLKNVPARVLLGIAHIEEKQDEQRWFSLALFIGILVSAVYLFTDIDELDALDVLDVNSVLRWALFASLATLLTGWGMGALLALLLNKRTELVQWQNRAGFGVLTGILWLGLLVIYFSVGQSGMNGDPARGAHVMTNSWVCPEGEGCDPHALLPGLEHLRNSGIFVAVAAGNEGPNCETIKAPMAIYDGSFTVGATDKNNVITTFSSRGPVTADGSRRIKPDIVAPGADILSANPNNSYKYSDGTSMATPHVAGAVALLWSANPDLIGDIDGTEEILTETATEYTIDDSKNCGGRNSMPNNIGGHGAIDVYEAVKRAISK